MNLFTKTLAVVSALAVSLVAISSPATAAETEKSVTYSAHVQTKGWMPQVSDGATAGTAGQALRVEAFKVDGINLTYRAHVQSIGWQEWKQEGQIAGTTGLAKRVEAFEIKSEDPDWKVEYRAHVQSIGWQPWGKDGSLAGTVGKGLRVEAFQIRLFEVDVPSSRAYVSTFTADNGINATSKELFYEMGRFSGADAGFILGDLAYVANKEKEFGTMVTDRVGFPIQLLGGNHEDDQTRDGLLSNYVKYLPDRLYETGSYAKHYYVDRGATRFIMIAPDMTFGGSTRTYNVGTPERADLVNWIEEAKANDQWVVVGTHMPCLSNGVHGCDENTDPDVTNLLIAEGVDLVLQGHEHQYTRSHQVNGTVGRTGVKTPVTTNLNIVDTDAQMVRGAGTVFAIVGNGGHNPRATTGTPSWVAQTSGTNTSGGITYGFVKVTSDSDSLDYEFVRTSGGTLQDSFTITR